MFFKIIGKTSLLLERAIFIPPLLNFKIVSSVLRVPSGNIIIETDILDNIVKEPLSYIKMDVEGWESKVIEGAKNTIKTYKPTLAVCVYHKCNDFWAIPEQILSIRDDYKIFLRHYTEGITETVMYFV